MMSSQPRKRRSDAHEDQRERAIAPPAFSGQNQSLVSAPAPLVTRNPLELRAFGLEDRADAVISSSATGGWSLNNLSQWRQDMGQTTASPHADAASKAYIAQRQRTFKQQMLRSAKQPPSSQ